MTATINATLESILTDLEAETGALGAQISALKAKFEANQSLIQAIKGKLGIATSCASASLSPQLAVVSTGHGPSVSSSDYGWLSGAIKEYIQEKNGSEFSPKAMMVDISARNPHREIARTAVYPILRKLVTEGFITQTQAGSGKRPSKYKANEFSNSLQTETQPEGTA
ncbi:MAG: hypothetical protein ACFUZC_09865 [Chthoniobacteraceae bacterium]